jgi:hypothetical protein
MKYLCLTYQDETLLQNRTKDEIEKMDAAEFAFAEVFGDSGQLVVEYRLQPTHAATTVRVREGKTLAADGPFACAREQIGGVFLIDATDLNEAIQVASKIPGARLGGIEVRPIYASY